jgi:hypothetical protein
MGYWISLPLQRQPGQKRTLNGSIAILFRQLSADGNQLLRPLKR